MVSAGADADADALKHQFIGSDAMPGNGKHILNSNCMHLLSVCNPPCSKGLPFCQV